MKYSLVRFVRNLFYLARFNLKEIQGDSKTYIKHRHKFAAKLRNEIKNDFAILNPPRIKSNFETLQELLTTNKSIIRFGDGEYILMGGGGIPFQSYDKKLAQKLREIITSEHESLLLGLSHNHFHVTPLLTKQLYIEHDYGWVIENYDLIMSLAKEGKEYGNCGISQVYSGSSKNYDYERHYSMMRELFSHKKIVVVCGDRVLAKVQYSIFEGIDSQIEYLYGPTKNAYSDIARLQKELEKKPKDSVLLFALGPAGKALAYMMFLQGYRVLDIGHTIKDYDTYKRNVVMDEEAIIDFYAPDA